MALWTTTRRSTRLRVLDGGLRVDDRSNRRSSTGCASMHPDDRARDSIEDGQAASSAVVVVHRAILGRRR